MKLSTVFNLIILFIFISSGPFLSLHLNLQAMFYRFIRGKACVVDSIVTFCDRKRQGAEAVSGTDSLGVSRAGLSAQAIDLEELILKIWNKQSRLSRAGLRRDLQVLLGVSEEN